MPGSGAPEQDHRTKRGHLNREKTVFDKRFRCCKGSDFDMMKCNIRGSSSVGTRPYRTARSGGERQTLIEYHQYPAYSLKY